jgi:RNA polymerase sigma-70 factor (ECF subfamily)
MDSAIEDKELIRKYLQGDRISLDFLIERHFKMVYAFVYRNVGSETDAEDITQEVFVKVWKNIKKFDQNKDFKPWVFQIAKNTSIDFLRKKKSIPFSRFENEQGQNALVDNMVAPASNLIEKLSDKQTMVTAMKGLNEKEQRLINLRNIEGLSFREIAETLKESINTIKSRYRRALLVLKKNIKGK